MITIIHKCVGCGYEAAGKTEKEAEIDFDQHMCVSMKKLKNLSKEELYAMIQDRCMKTKGIKSDGR